VTGGEDSWSQVLVANRFEIYGSLLPADAPLLSNFKSPPVYYGSSTATPYVAPSLIRADPLIMRELQEIIVLLMKPQNESKTEKIRVHEIVLQ